VPCFGCRLGSAPGTVPVRWPVARLFATVLVMVVRRSGRVRLRIVVDDRLVRSLTHVRRATPNVVVWESIVPELDIDLRSAYTGRRGAAARVEHLVLTSAADIEPAAERAVLPLFDDVRRDPFDHLLRLVELLEGSGHRAQISQLGRVERLREAIRLQRSMG